MKWKKWNKASSRVWRFTDYSRRSGVAPLRSRRRAGLDDRRTIQRHGEDAGGSSEGTRRRNTHHSHRNWHLDQRGGTGWSCQLSIPSDKVASTSWIQKSVVHSRSTAWYDMQQWVKTAVYAVLY